MHTFGDVNKKLELPLKNHRMMKDESTLSALSQNRHVIATTLLVRQSDGNFLLSGVDGAWYDRLREGCITSCRRFVCGDESLRYF